MNVCCRMHSYSWVVFFKEIEHMQNEKCMHSLVLFVQWGVHIKLHNVVTVIRQVEMKWRTFVVECVVQCFLKVEIYLKWSSLRGGGWACLSAGGTLQHLQRAEKQLYVTLISGSSQ